MEEEDYPKIMSERLTNLKNKYEEEISKSNSALSKTKETVKKVERMIDDAKKH